LERLRTRGATVDAAALAHHFGRSAPLGNACAAVAYAVEAGGQAMRALAYETAAQRFRQALRALELDPSVGDRVELLLLLANALAAQGAATDAQANYVAAAGLARSTQRSRELARAALGRSGGAGIEVPLLDREQVGLLEEAIEALRDSDPGLGAWLRARLSVALTPFGSLERRLELAEEALRQAEAASDDDALAYALAAHCDVIAGPGDVERRERQARRVVELAVARRSIRLELLGRRLVIEALLEQGRFDEVELAVGAYESAAAAVRDPAYDFYVPLWRAALSLLRADRTSFEHWHGVLEVAISAGGGNASVLAGVQQLFAAADLGDPDAAVAALEALAPTTATMVEPQAAITVALMRSLAGDRDSALASLARVAAAARAMAQDSEWLPALVQLADLAVSGGAHALVDWAYEALRPFAALWAVEGIGAAVRGPVERALGILAAQRGDVSTARAHFDRALAACRAAGARLWEERTRADAARCAALPPPQPLSVAQAALIREGDLWRVDFAGATARVRDSKGLRDIARLLAQPDQPLSALELVAERGPVVVQSDTGPPLDDTAFAAYRHRLAELERQLDAADTAGDAGRSTALVAERDTLIRGLASARGLGGRARTSGSSAERARTAVATRIRDALRRLEPAHPQAAHHLSRSLRTGTYCAYEPDPPIAWQVSASS
jgi:tetratricopeptide (TPR) repeat protein